MRKNHLRQKNTPKKKGFTIIELLVTISVFSIIIVGFLELFSSAFKEQGRNLNKAYLLNNASYVTEYMGRALRMAKKDINGVCISPKSNYELLSPDHIKFLNYKGECEEFFLENNVLKVKRIGYVHELTPFDIQVGKLSFVVSGETQNDELQPKVTFALVLKNKSEQLNLQTTISQRDLDVKY
jgi:prepilin-type N-terminal cleavage/methylation domain-containing protein